MAAKQRKIKKTIISGFRIACKGGPRLDRQTGLIYSNYTNYWCIIHEGFLEVSWKYRGIENIGGFWWHWEGLWMSQFEDHTGVYPLQVAVFSSTLKSHYFDLWSFVNYRGNMPLVKDFICPKPTKIGFRAIQAV